MIEAIYFFENLLLVLVKFEIFRFDVQFSNNYYAKDDCMFQKGSHQWSCEMCNKDFNFGCKVSEAHSVRVILLLVG